MSVMSPVTYPSKHTEVSEPRSQVRQPPPEKVPELPARVDPVPAREVGSRRCNPLI